MLLVFEKKKNLPLMTGVKNRRGLVGRLMTYGINRNRSERTPWRGWLFQTALWYQTGLSIEKKLTVVPFCSETEQLSALIFILFTLKRLIKCAVLLFLAALPFCILHCMLFASSLIKWSHTLHLLDLFTATMWLKPQNTMKTHEPNLCSACFWHVFVILHNVREPAT